jgi:hypothetical protein
VPRLPSSAVAPKGFFLVCTQAAKRAVLRGEVSFLAGGGVNCDPCNEDFTRYPLGVLKNRVGLGLQEVAWVLFSASPQRV